MDVPHGSALQLQDNSLLFHCQSLLDPSFQDMLMDPGYVSAGSSLSPTSSVDSFSFSPASLQRAPLDSVLLSSRPAPGPSRRPQSLQSCTGSSSGSRRSRSRFPGRKRQTASEREKLRMRDLTKALHHLRSFLPPAGRTLTKIETLRLAIGYVAHLSAQLGLGQEAPEQRPRPPTPARLCPGHSRGGSAPLLLTAPTGACVRPRVGPGFPSSRGWFPPQQQAWTFSPH